MGAFLMTWDDEASSASYQQKVVCLLETTADDVRRNVRFVLGNPCSIPLNYGDQSISDFRSRTADFKSGTLALALSKKSAADLRGGGALPAQNFSRRYPV